MASSESEHQPTFAQKLPQDRKNLFVAGLAEFIGTFLFLFFALGGVTAVNTASPQNQILAANPAQLAYICLCFGLALAVTVWIFFRVSGGQFNPAVTLSLVMVGAVGPFRGLVVFIAQILGSVCACAVLSALLPGPFVAGTMLRGDTSISRGLFIEMFATSLLVLAVLFLAVEKHRATFAAPLCIGLALFSVELMSVPYTGGSVNPARSFGPCVATRDFPHYHWIYWIGPFLGSLLATGFYKLVKVLEYETTNPGQDDSGEPLVKMYGDFRPELQKHHHSGSDVTGNRAANLESKLSGDTAYKNGPGLEAGNSNSRAPLPA